MYKSQWGWILASFYIGRNWDWKSLDPLPKPKGKVRIWTQVCFNSMASPLKCCTTKNIPGGYLAIFKSVTTVCTLTFSQLSLEDMPVLSRGLGKIAWIIQHKLSVPLQKQHNKRNPPSSMKSDFHIHLRCPILFISLLQTSCLCIQALKVSFTWNYRM